MPIYDLKCDACGHGFEKFVQGFIKEEEKECPRCYSRNVSQRYTGGSFGIGTSRSGSGGFSSGSGGCTPPPGSSFG